MRYAFIYFLLALAISCGDDSSDSDQPQMANHSDHHSNDQDTDSNMEATSADGSLKVKLNHDPSPLKAGSLYTFHIQFLDANDQPYASDLHVDKFEPFMKSMNHGANNPDLGKPMAHGDTTGHYMVENVRFSMSGEAGSWVIELAITRDGQTEELSVALPEVL